MKKLMSLMLGMSLVFGTAALSFAQPKKEEPKKEEGKDGKKKKEEPKKKEGTR